MEQEFDSEIVTKQAQATVLSWFIKHEDWDYDDSDPSGIFFGFSKYPSFVSEERTPVERPAYVFFGGTTVFLDVPFSPMDAIDDLNEELGSWGIGRAFSSYTYHLTLTHDQIVKSPESSLGLVRAVLDAAADRDYELTGDIAFQADRDGSFENEGVARESPSTPLISETIEDYVLKRDEWLEKYGIQWSTFQGHEDLTDEKLKSLSALDEKKLIWTQFSDGAEEVYQPGMPEFIGKSPRSEVLGYVQAERPWEEELEIVRTAIQLSCPVCNKDGSGQGEDDCQGPTTDDLPQTNHSLDWGECQGGYVYWFLD